VLTFPLSNEVVPSSAVLTVLSFFNGETLLSFLHDVAATAETKNNAINNLFIILYFIVTFSVNVPYKNVMI
jgi:hypothetical protein